MAVRRGAPAPELSLCRRCGKAIRRSQPRRPRVSGRRCPSCGRFVHLIAHQRTGHVVRALCYHCGWESERPD